MERRDFIKSALVAFTFPNIIIPKYEETDLRKVFILHKTLFYTIHWYYGKRCLQGYVYSWRLHKYSEIKSGDILLFIDDSNKTLMDCNKGGFHNLEVRPSIATRDAYIFDGVHYAVEMYRFDNIKYWYNIVDPPMIITFEKFLEEYNINNLIVKTSFGNKIPVISKYSVDDLSVIHSRYHETDRNEDNEFVSVLI